MEALKGEFMNLALGIIENVQMPMSFAQVLVIGVFFGFCLYIGQVKIGMLVSFFTITYWAYVSNKVWILETANGSIYGMLAAITVGMAVAFIGFVGIFQERH